MFHCSGLYAVTTQLELAVIAFFQCIVQIRRRVHLAIVFDFFIAFDFNDRTILEGESVGRIFQILFLDQHTLEHFRIKAEGGASL